EMSAEDATALGYEEGDLLEIASPRGRVEARLRITGVRGGTLFLPFHYGYWDQPGGTGPRGRRGTAANELTITDWDPASKQPLFKTSVAAVSLVRRRRGVPSAAPTTAGSRP